MKKFNYLSLLLIGALFMFAKSTSAQVVWQDNFDTYVGDSILETQSSNWVGWGNVITSSLVSTDTSFSGANSLKNWDGSTPGAAQTATDVIPLLGDSTTGRYILSFKTYVPSDDGNNKVAGTYYSIMQTVVNATGSDRSLEVYLGPKGASYVSIPGRTNIPIAEKLDQWVTITHVLDLDSNRMDFFYDGVWIASAPFAYGSTPIRLAGMDIYSTCAGGNCTPLGYFDDFELKHFAHQNNDGGIVAANAANFCTGDTLDLDIDLKNWGYNTITSAKIGWTLNGVAQTPISYSGFLLPDSVTNFYLGKFKATGTAPYQVKFWIDSVNGGLDTVAFNDTLESQIGGAALHGNYTVNALLPASSTNFQSVQDMVAALNLSGICDSTYITIASGTYNTALTLSNIVGLDSTATLTIDGSDSSKTIISQSGAVATLLFSNVNYVTVKNLTLKNTRSSGAAVIFHDANYNTVSNCYTWVDPISTSGGLYNMSFSGSATSYSGSNPLVNYNTIKNNRMIGGYYGLRSYSNNTTPLPVGNKILNNDIDSVYYYGLYLQGNDVTDIIGNKVNMLSRSNANATGIRVSYSVNQHINANDVKSGGYGIYWYNYQVYATTRVRRNEFINNMVYSEGNNTVYFRDIDSVDVLFNTCYQNGSSSSYYPAYFYNSSIVYGYDVRNNIFFAKSSPAMYTNQADTMFGKFNYNIFYSPYSTLLRIANSSYSDLLSYQTAKPQFNSKSLQGDPMFISPFNLHLVGTLANDVGDNGTSITTDIDGDTRPIGTSLTVDIGADEYDLPTCPPPSNIADSVGTYVAKLNFTPNSLGNYIQIELMKCGQQLGSGTIYSLNTDSIYLTNLSSSTCYNYYIREACGRGDTSIWLGPFQFNTSLPSPTGVNCINGTASIVYSEDFEQYPVKNGWIGDIGIAEAQGHWNVGIPGLAGFPSSGPSYAHSGNRWMLSEVVNNYNNDFKMVSPMIDLSQVNDSAELSFWLHGYGSGLGTFKIGASTSQNGPFTNIFTYAAEGKQLVTSAAGPYTNVGVRLDTFVGRKIFLEFDVDPFGTMYQGQFGLDLIEVTACVTCNTPDSLNIENTKLNQAELNWHEKGSATSWQLSYDTTFGFNPDQGNNMPVVSTNPYTVTGLNPGSIYYYYVRSICGSGDTSGWYGPIVQEAAYPIPYFEDLESFGSIDDETMYPWPNSWSHDASQNNNSQVHWESGRGPQRYGPNVDHTLGTTSGSYVFLSNGGSTGDSAFFISPNIYIDSNATAVKLSYWYHFISNGFLEVWVDSNGVSQMVDIINSNLGQASQSDPWLQSRINLIGYQGKVVDVTFVAIKGSAHSSNVNNIAVDDIKLEAVDAADISPTAILQPSDCIGAGNQTIEVEVTNVGTDTIRGYDVSFVVNGGTVVTESDTSDIYPAQTISYQFNANAYFPTKGSYDLMVYTSVAVDTIPINDTIRATYQINGIPDTADFEGLPEVSGPIVFANGWSASGNGGFQWNSNSGSTGSGGTGPDADNTTRSSTGIYMYTEASSGSTNDTAYLTSKCYDLSTATAANTLTLEYWYHMYGATIQGLTVQLDSAGTWVTIDTLLGQKQSANADTFLMRTVNLNAYTGLNSTSLRFVVARGTSFTGDVAIDDISLLSNATPTTILPYYPIATINTEDANGVADSLNVVAWTSGTVVGVDLNAGNGLGFTLIDMSSSSQEGIYVYSSNDVSNYSVTEGDSIKVSGMVGQFNGLTQFNVDSVEVLSTGNAIPNARLVTTLDETTESNIIKLEHYIMLDPSLTTSGTSYTMQAANGTDTIDIRINSLTEVDDSLAINGLIVGDTICVEGIGGQYDTSTPYTDGYQISPMYAAGLFKCVITGLDGNKLKNGFSFYPNPTNGEFTIVTDGLENDNAILTVRDISGKVILEENIANSSNAFHKTYNLSEYAKGLYLISILDGEKQINKKLILK